MALPYKRLPAAIVGVPNGQIPDSLLSEVHNCGLYEKTAARALKALNAAAALEGLVVGSVGDYRSYGGQVYLFEHRYAPKYNPNTNRVYQWKGQTWWLQPGQAGAAFPGSSNHGLGLANDFALWIPGSAVPVSLDTRPAGAPNTLWNWLTAHGRTYGWSWGEAESERWHWVYIEGDNIPQAVLKFEEDIVLQADIDAVATKARDLILASLPDAIWSDGIPARYGAPSGPAEERLTASRVDAGAAKTAAQQATAAVTALGPKLDGILAAVGGVAADVDAIPALLTAVQNTVLAAVHAIPTGAGGTVDSDAVTAAVEAAFQTLKLTIGRA